MPLRETTDFGTDANGSKSEEYCFHCYQNGNFLDEGITLGEKIEKNVKFGVMMGWSEEKARSKEKEELTILNSYKRKTI